MATLTITTGTWRGTEPGESFELPWDGEIDPELVFRATNRINDAPEDLAALPEIYQPLRLTLDQREMPSMSVGDSFTVTSDAGVVVGHWRCDSFGWTTTGGAPS